MYLVFEMSFLVNVEGAFGSTTGPGRRSGAGVHPVTAGQTPCQCVEHLPVLVMLTEPASPCSFVTQT